MDQTSLVKRNKGLRTLLKIVKKINMKKKIEETTGKVKTRQEIAHEYGIDRKTFYRWIKRNNLPISNGLIFPSEMELIYKTFGLPGGLNKYRSSVTER